MPKVDGKHYSYSPKGIAKAKSAAKKKGVEVKYRHGGRAMPRMMNKGGAAWKSEKKANPGIGNCPASVKKAL